MANLTSTLTMRLIDDVTKPARSVAQALKDAERNAKQVAEAIATDGARAGDKLVKSLAGLKLSAKDIEEVAESWKDYSKAAGLAAKASDWTKAQTADVRRWEAQTISALRSVEREQQAFARSVATAGTAGVSPIAAAMSANAIANARLKRGMSAPIVVQSPTEMQKAETRARRGKAGSAVAASEIGAADGAAAGGLFGRLGLGHVATGDTAYKAGEHAVRSGASYQHAVTSLQNIGITPEELEHVKKTAAEVTRAAPGTSVTEALEQIRETIGAFGSLEHAVEHASTLAQINSVLKAAGREGVTTKDNAQNFVRYFEERGIAGNGERFQKEAKEQARAMAFFGEKYNPAEMLNFAQQAKSALVSYNERFATKIVPSLVTMLGGEHAGTAANMFDETVEGRVNDKLQAKEWMRLGLLDPKQVIMKAGHAVAWKPGAVKNTDKAMADPLAWIEEDLLPALAKGGYKTEDPLSMRKALALLFRNSSANLFASGLALPGSRQRLHKDEERQNKVGTFEEINQRNQTQDPKAALKEVTSAFDDLGAALTSSAPMGEMLHGLATHIRELSDVVGSLPSFDRMKKAEEEAKNQAKREGRKSTLLDWWHHMDDSNSYANSFEKYKHPFKKVFARHTQHPAFVRRMTSADFIAGPYGSMGGMGVPSTTPTFARMEGVTPHVDAHELDAAKIKAEEAKKAVDGLNETVVTRFDSSSLDAFISKAQLALSLVSKLEAARAGASANLPALGKVQRSNFSFGGVQGE